MTMGERIHNLRKQHNMTQLELSQRIGVSRVAVLKYEKGEVVNIPYETIVTMANLFGVSPAYIQCFDEWDNDKQLADEVALIERIQAKWGKDTITLLNNFLSLNTEGRKAILNMTEDYNCLSKYHD